MKMLRRSHIDLSRLAGEDERGKRTLASFMGLAPGMRFGGGWTVVTLAQRADELDVTCLSDAGPAETFFVGITGRGPACPFDRHGFRIGYHPSAKDFASIVPVGNAFADMVASILDADPAGWDAALAVATKRGDGTGLTEDDLRIVEIRPDGKVYIRMTNDCQERCVFCFYYGTPQEIGSDGASCESIDRVIDSLDPASTTQVILTGGEPTLVPGFDWHLQRLVDRGFSNIIVQTNGLLTARRGFLDRFAAFNERISFGFSLHAATAGTSATVTGVPSEHNFPEKIASIRRAIELGYITKITCVITTHNLHELTDIVRFCQSTGRDGAVPDNVILQFSMPVIRGLAAGSRNSCPRLADVAKAVGPALDLADRSGLKTSFSSMCSVPPCCVPDHLRHLESMWYRQGPTEWWEAERAFGQDCVGCALKAWCSGVSPLYLEWFGPEELVPFSTARTRIVMPDDERRS